MATASGQFVRYLAVGVASVGVDSGALVLFYGGLGAELWLATTAAFLLAFVVNFGLNFTWVFGARARVAERLLRYGSLVVVNYVVTIAVVLGLSTVGLHYLLAKWVAIGLCVLLNFFAYRLWIFA